jgi:hypothetical protein
MVTMGIFTLYLCIQLVHIHIFSNYRHFNRTSDLTRREKTPSLPSHLPHTRHLIDPSPTTNRNQPWSVAVAWTDLEGANGFSGGVQACGNDTPKSQTPPSIASLPLLFVLCMITVSSFASLSSHLHRLCSTTNIAQWPSMKIRVRRGT